MADLDLTKATRVCRKHGGEPLLLIQFFPHNKNGPDGFDKMCKQCWKNRPKKNSAQLLSGSVAKVGKKAKQEDEPVNERKVKIPKVAEEVPDHLESVRLKRLADLPFTRKLFEWQGPLASGLKKYKDLYDVDAKVVYTFVGQMSVKYFIG